MIIDMFILSPTISVQYINTANVRRMQKSITTFDWLIVSVYFLVMQHKWPIQHGIKRHRYNFTKSVVHTHSQYSILHNTMQYTIQYNTIQYNTIHYTIQIQYNTMHYTIQCKITQYTIQYKIIHYTIQYNTIKYNTSGTG